MTSGVSGTDCETVNDDAETQETGSGHARPHGKRTRQENDYIQRIATMTKSSNAQSPTGTDNHE